jgi:hypothetical protein
VFGPFFFDDQGHAVTVTGESYHQMLVTFLKPLLEDENSEELWFQLDVATSHTARETMTLLREMFPNHVMLRFGNNVWPPSPIFFLWGFL